MIWDDLLMQGRSRMDRELLDAEMIAGHLVPPGSVFAFLAEHRSELFPDSFTADLFPSRTGRPSLPADLVGSVLVLKELYDLSDPQTADALKYDIRWKVACGRSLTQMSFDASTLVYWRKRIAKSGRPDRVFDAVAEVIAATGILRGRRKRCVDSTVFDDAVATQDTVTQLVAAMRKVARVVPGAADVIKVVCRLDYSKPGKPPIDWDDPDAKAALVSALVNDALAVLAELTGPDSPGRDAAEADALGLLALVAGQDVEPAEDSDGTDGRWRIARKVAPDRVISTVDREARHTRKSKSKRRDGFRGHLAAEPETGLITDCEMTMAAGPGGSDAENGVKMACRDRFHGSAEGGDDAASAGEGTGAVPGAPQPEEPGDQEREDGLEMYGDSASAAARPAPPARQPVTTR
jgi:transposase